MYTNVDSTTSGTFTHTRATTNSTYYAYLRGFDFDTIPSTATVNSFTVKIKASATGHTTSTSSSYYMSLYNGTTSIGSTTASGRLSTSTTTFTFSNGSMTWSTLKGYGANFGIRIPLRRASSNTADVVTVYGAEILVDYTARATVHVTGVSLDKNTDTIQEEATTQLTATVTPSNATDKSVTWSSSNTSVATVNSSGLVTGVSAGSATITVTTTDGSYTASCTVTVTAAERTDYVLATSLQPGKSYIIANGNSGSVYMLSTTAGSSGQLQGVSATVTDGKISITAATAANVVFECDLSTAGNDYTTHLKNGSQYLRVNNANGLHMSSTDDRWWHFRDGKFWLWTSSADDGYTDTSSNYKYYLQVSSGQFQRGYVTSPSIRDSTLPAIYLFTEDTGGGGSGTGQLYVKRNGSWHTIGSVYVKQNGSWVLQSDFSVFDTSAYYIRG